MIPDRTFSSNVLPISDSSDSKIGVPNTLYSKYQKQFKEISAGNPKTGLLALIRRIIGFFFCSITNELKFSAYMTVEHMSQGTLSGSRIDKSIAYMKGFLTTINSPAALTIGKAFAYADSLHNNFLFSVRKTKKKVKSLKTGESIAFFVCSSNHHAMIMVVTCTNDTPGKKIYKLEQHNRGEGITDYHYKKVTEDGNILFQAVLEIPDVPEENLLGKKAKFFNEVIGKKNSIKTFYEKIIPLAGGQIAGPSSDERFWQPAQTGGSCTVACMRSVLRCHLSPEEHQHFEETARYELFLKTYRRIITGTGNTTVQKTVALEMVKEIQQSLLIKGIEPASELEEMKSKLQNMIKNKKTSSHSKILYKVNNKTVLDNLHHAFTLIKEGEPALAKDYLLTADRLKNVEMSQADINKLRVFSALVTKFCDKTPLNKEEIAYMAALSATLHSISQKIKEKTNLTKKIRESIVITGKLYRKIHLRFNFLQLHTSPDLQSIIEPGQKNIVNIILRIKNQLKI